LLLRCFDLFEYVILLTDVIGKKCARETNWCVVKRWTNWYVSTSWHNVMFL